MDGVRGIESLAAGDGRHQLFRTLGPTLLISMAYIDLGKWVATVDAGSRFGYDLVLMVLLFNFSAILCQYLSICIGMVTGKNLAEICHQEYSQAICVVLGLQAALSLLISEVTMIAGIAVGFNLVFEYDDLVAGLCFASVAVNLLPYIISRLDKRMAGTLNACIAGFTLLCFVLGILVSQPKIPVNVNAMFPKLSGESAYSLMALLGSNVIAHNFYVHSSVVQVQRRSPLRTLGSLFHDHLFSILFIFAGVFLVNYILLSSAADEFSNTMLINCQDAIELMSQICMNPLAPVVLLVILLFSSLIISLSSIIGSDVISENFFGVKLPHSAHHLLLKGLSTIPTIYYTKVAGSEGMYQLLIICGVVQAMLLPSSVIPVFRVSSSRFLMGRYRISLYVETLAILAFLLMLFTNIIFVAEILFGDSRWTKNMKRNTGSPIVLPYAAVLLISCASIAFTLFLAATPLKSASVEAETQEPSAPSQWEILGVPHHKEETSHENAAIKEVQRFSVDDVPRDPSEGQQKSAFESADSSSDTIESYHNSQYPTTHTDINPEAHAHGHPSPSITLEEITSDAVDWTEPMPKVCAATKVKSTAEKVVGVESDVLTDKCTEVSCNLELKKSDGGKLPSFTSDGPPFSTLSRGKDADAANLRSSGSRPSGLGRAARKQLAAILDEFWGHHFDYHGRLTEEATTKCFNYFIGLDLRTASSAVRTDNLSEASWSPSIRDAMRGSATILNSWDPVSHDSPDLDFGLQTGAMGLSTWSRSMHLANRDIPSSGRNAETSYDNQFYQPTTIHGYQLATYLKGINASRGPLSSIPLDPLRFPRSSESALPNYTSAFMHARNQNVPGSSSLQGPTMERLSTMALERSYYDPTPVGDSESGCSSAYSKKYHSSPDISAVIAASRKALSNEANLGGGVAANQSYLGRLAYEKSKYVDSATRSQSRCAINELAQHNLRRGVLPAQCNINTDTKSLWTQQPFEQLFGVPSRELNKSEVNTDRRSSSAAKGDFSYTEYEAELVRSIRFCIMKLLKLEGSGWLFMQSGGCDENLIDQVAEAERVSLEEATGDRDANLMCRLPKCGDDCVWQASLVISFGVWCIRRVLDLSLVESRPELWGKYTYVLNRLQGILDPAFSKPRKPVSSCACLEKAGPAAKPIPGTFTTAAMVLEAIKGVEQAVSGRKGRSGTAAGDVAFPKGKENLSSVLKRYKRRLSGKKTSGQ
ncbi:hypothetical protein ACP70R_025240 [Stipagrostis hirtigluma subsp. patula]